jgi:hypothetical protein
MTAESEHVPRPTDRAKSAPRTPTPAFPPLLSRDGDHFVPKSAARVRTAPGDGSCLFHALIFGLHAFAFGAPADHVELRRMLYQRVAIIGYSLYQRVAIIGYSLYQRVAIIGYSL